jgi:hypothetical protein
MSDWTDTLDARRAGFIEGFHGAGDPIEDLADDEVPSTGALAPDSDAPPPPAHPVESATGGHRRAVTKKQPAKKASAARKRS